MVVFLSLKLYQNENKQERHDIDGDIKCAYIITNGRARNEIKI